MNCYYDVVKFPNEIFSKFGRSIFKQKRKSGIEVSVVIDDHTGRGISFFPNLIVK